MKTCGYEILLEIACNYSFKIFFQKGKKACRKREGLCRRGGDTAEQILTNSLSCTPTLPSQIYLSLRKRWGNCGNELGNMDQILRWFSFGNITYMACASSISEIKGCFAIDYSGRMDHEDPPQDSGCSISQIYLWKEKSSALSRILARQGCSISLLMIHRQRKTLCVCCSYSFICRAKK